MCVCVCVCAVVAGLSYATFAYKSMSVKPSTKTTVEFNREGASDALWTATVTVQNTAAVAGTEVVQVWCWLVGWWVGWPVGRLVGWLVARSLARFVGWLAGWLGFVRAYAARCLIFRQLLRRRRPAGWLADWQALVRGVHRTKIAECVDVARSCLRVLLCSNPELKRLLGWCCFWWWWRYFWW